MHIHFDNAFLGNLFMVAGFLLLAYILLPFVYPVMMGVFALYLIKQGMRMKGISPLWFVQQRSHFGSQRWW